MKFCKKCGASKCCCADIRKLRKKYPYTDNLSAGDVLKRGDYTFGWHQIPETMIGQRVPDRGLFRRHGLKRKLPPW